ncbi:hard-surface induced protein [Colletotrichum graminicola]|nr:hard-surface induced protein [Colletotrichum graminicola]
MFQSPRFLPFLLISASILLLLGTLHVSGDKVHEVLAPINRWSTSSSQSHDQKGAQNIIEGTQDDAPHGKQGSSPAAIPASNRPIFGGKNQDNRPTFTDLALKSGTDKVTSHNYGFLYDKYLAQFRNEPVKMIEIGLGCGMVRINGPNKLIRGGRLLKTRKLYSLTDPALLTPYGPRTSRISNSTLSNTMRPVALPGQPRTQKPSSSSVTSLLCRFSTTLAPRSQLIGWWTSLSTTAAILWTSKRRLFGSYGHI